MSTINILNVSKTQKSTKSKVRILLHLIKMEHRDIIVIVNNAALYLHVLRAKE